MRGVRLFQGLAALSCLAGTAVHAEERAAEPPDDALLEFLGGFETTDGEWVDPLVLTDLDRANAAADDSDGKPDDGNGEDEDDS